MNESQFGGKVEDKFQTALVFKTGLGSLVLLLKHIMRHLNTWSGNHQQSLGLLLLNLSSPAFRALFLLFNLPAGASVTN